MNVEIRGDTAIISGYVNAVERYSKPINGTLRNKLQTFIEKVKAGVFKTALKRNDDVKVLLNHDMDRELANTKNGSAKLEEDNIGLRAEVIVTDKEVVEKARNNKLVGWSFGFYSNADEIGKENEITTRTLIDLDLAEVSILDDTRSPAYYGTSIETRSEGGRTMEVRENEMVEEEKQTENVQATTEVDIEMLAEVVARKVVEMLQASTDTKAEGNEPETEEPKAEDEKTEEEEKPEDRAIDYSTFESRIANLN